MKLYYETNNTDTLAHWGIKGQKWGIRRFQNEDGSLTDAGKKRYGIQSDGTMSKGGQKRYEKDTYKELSRADEERYRNDLGKAIESAEANGDLLSARYMRDAYNSGQRYAIEVIGNGLVGGAISGLVASAKGKRGSDLVKSILKGSLGGAIVGALSRTGAAGRGMLIAENNYGVAREKYADEIRSEARNKAESFNRSLRK